MTAIIILNYNNSEDTVNCINSIEQFNTAEIKYIIVDNGSPRQEAVPILQEYLAQKFGEAYLFMKEGDNAPKTLPRVTLYASTVNDGYACGNNKGLRITEGDDEVSRILILNNDILFVDDIIPGLIRKADSLDDCAIISPVLYKKDMQGLDLNCARRAIKVSELIKKNFLHYVYRLINKECISNRYLIDEGYHTRGTNIIPIELPSGSCMLIDKDFFKGIGYFDPNTFLYNEEDILYAKIRKKGKKNYLDLDTKCIHLGASSTNSSPSLFIVDSGFNSECYYVHNYSDCNDTVKIIHAISVKFGRSMFKLQQGLYKKKK
jgi:hypothetical protein